jgi:hypothetical protein
MANWWSGIPTNGDTFSYNANPSSGIVETPVLFCADQGNQKNPNLATEFTTNFVNSLVNGGTVYTGIAYGPSVAYLGNGAPASDILQDYAADMFQNLNGIQNVVDIDGRYYHDEEGFLHCATNVIRAIPTTTWWSH